MACIAGDDGSRPTGRPPPLRRRASIVSCMPASRRMRPASSAIKIEVSAVAFGEHDGWHPNHPAVSNNVAQQTPHARIVLGHHAQRAGVEDEDLAQTVVEVMRRRCSAARVRSKRRA